MNAICFVCNLPIFTHQVGLVWQGANGWDDLVREQLEESVLQARLGGRKDSSTQITCMSPPCDDSRESTPPPRRRRSSLAQLTDLLKDWSGTTVGRRRKEQLSRRETLADFARTLPWGRRSSTLGDRHRKRRESDWLIKSSKRKDSEYSAARVDIYRSLNSARQRPPVGYYDSRRTSVECGTAFNIGNLNPRRSSGDSDRERQISSPIMRKRQSSASVKRRESKLALSEPSRIVSSTLFPSRKPNLINSACQTTPVTVYLPLNKMCRMDSGIQSYSMQTPTIITSSVTPPNGSPSVSPPLDTRRDSSPTSVVTCSASVPSLSKVSVKSAHSSLQASPLHSPVAERRISDSIAQAPQANATIPRASRRDSLTTASTNHIFKKDSTAQMYAKRINNKTLDHQITKRDIPLSRLNRLHRQATAIDETCIVVSDRRGSQPTLTADSNHSGHKARRDSLSPDSARGRRDSRAHLSPEREIGCPPRLPPRLLRRQSTSYAIHAQDRRRSTIRSRSPDSCSSISSGEQPQCRRPSTMTSKIRTRGPGFRRQSTTEEILIARGFRRQSTTEDLIRCRNFRRQSSHSDSEYRYSGRRDSSAQISDGTLSTMVVETGVTYFDSATQTDPSPLYDNNHYHEECLRCNSCGLNLTGPNHKRARRYKNQILCDLHFADVALMECSDFMQQLRSFKPQSLGCAVARRKSSTTLIFPLPPQACSDEFCEDYPHSLIPTPGYWIECSRQKIGDNAWDTNSDSEPQDDDDGYQYNYHRHSDSLLLEDDEDFEQDELLPPPPKKKTTIEEQWESSGCFELTSVEQETYEKYFYGTEHWNYFTNDEDLGPVVLSLKQESINNRDQFRILVRAISYTAHGLIPTACVFADRYNREEVVRSLGREVNFNPPLILGQLPDTPEELLKLDQVFIKSELKVGVIYVREGQYTEEEILDNNENSFLFTEFLNLLGDTVLLKGFEKYRGGLDTSHDLTGEFSVYTNWRNIEIMFHVSTFLPYEKHDVQKLQRKRHIGNDIVCVVFLEADNTSFSPGCIKSHFLHTFIVVRTSPQARRKVTKYEISVVSRDEVGAYKPYLWEQSVFENGPMLREWLLTKIVNGERASYSAPKFARMQERTRSQMLEDLVANLQNHVETGQIPKPYRRGSWRPIGHMRPSSPLMDSVKDRFEDYDQLATDFHTSFLNNKDNLAINVHMFDVTFLVGQGKKKTRFFGVRAILGVRSRVFQEMLFGISAGFGSPQMPVAEILARASPRLPSPKKPKPKSSNFLQVPDVDVRPQSAPSSPIVKRAFSRIGSITAGWGRSIRTKPTNSGLQLNVDDKKKWSSSQEFSNKQSKERDVMINACNLAYPRLSICADVEKIDKAKLAQTEFSIIEFDPETFRILLDYLHTSSCTITCKTIPGVICAAEHYDLPELLHACFHHTKQFIRLNVICHMINSLENYVWRYNSAVELVDLIFKFIQTHALAVLNHPDFLTLSESMVNQIMNRDLEVPEIRKFEAIVRWAKHKSAPKENSKQEFKHIMERLKKDIDLMKISPQDLIKIVLPTKVIENKAILDTLSKQANSGIYRLKESLFQDFHERVQRQTTRLTATEWDSIDQKSDQ